MTEDIRDGKLTLTWPWTDAKIRGILGVVFGVVGVGQLLGVSWVLVPLLLGSTDLTYALVIGFCLLFCLGILGGMALIVAQKLLNKTEVTVGEGKLAVKHFPISWGEPKWVSLPEVEGVYLEKYQVKTNKGGQRVLYSIQAGLHSGRQVTLISGLTAERGQAVEKWLQRAVGTSPA